MSKRRGDGIGTCKKLAGLKPNGVKEKDEDLLLFREMHKREKDRVVSLLQPVSDEFEANENYALCGMAPNGKKGQGYDILGEGGKNDYDWLKTPPATPLFQSLEMETNGPELVTQREIPIIQPLSRFSGNLEVENGSIRPTISPSLKSNVPPRYSTPSGRPTISLSEKKNSKSATVLNDKMNQPYSYPNLENSKKASSTVKPVDSKESNRNMLPSNLSKSMDIGMDSSSKATKPKSRGVSPLVRSKLPAQISGPSDETPPILRTDRSTSANRGRAIASQQNPSVSQKRPESVTKSRRQSYSPGASRGRKQDGERNLGSEKDRITQQANRTQVLGSRMVDRFLNSRMSSSEDRQSKTKLNASVNEGSDARKSSIEQRQNTTKFNTSINESSGFGRLMSKSSLDMALRHMEFQRGSGTSRKQDVTAGRRSVSVSKMTTSLS